MTIWTAEQRDPPAPRKGDWMQTFTGAQFWPVDPDQTHIHMADIAHSLSMQCRYAGHCIRFYSVAEHSVILCDWFLARGEALNAKWALLHDASEAYLVDVPRPLKPFLPGYREAEQDVTAAVSRRFNLLPITMPYAVKDADNRILVDESQQNMAPCIAPWNLPWEPLGVELHLYSPAEAEKEFLDRAAYLRLE